MKKNKRYPFWKVFWIVTGLYIFFGLLGFIVLSISPNIAGHVVNWKQFLTWKNIAGQCAKLLVTILFFYYAVNSYYNLIYERKGTSYYIKYSVIAIIFFGICFVFLRLNATLLLPLHWQGHMIVFFPGYPLWK